MKYAVVTGSTKGIGKAIAEKFLQEDFFVFVNYNRDDEACEKFKSDNKQYSGKFEVIKEDLSSYENAQSFIEKIKEKTNSIDALVLNCGVTDRSKFEDISKESWEHVMNVNVNVPFYLVQGFKSMIVESGSVVFVGSTLGKFPHATSLSYGVTKAAIQSMAKNLVKFFEDKAVTVNAVAPGFVETEWQKNI